MTIYINDTLRDAQLDKFITDCDLVHLVTAETTDYATAVASSMGSFTPVFTKGDYVGTGGGRQVLLSAESGVPITSSGEVALNNFVFVNTTGSVVLQVNPASGKTYDNGDFANVPEVILTVVPDATLLGA